MSNISIFCIEEFKTEFDKLISKNAYAYLEKELIAYFFNKSLEELKSGTLLNNNHIVPYIKKRLGGRGGLRVYYLMIIKKEQLYLMFVHSKTGPYASSNIKDDFKSALYKKVYEDIKSNHLYKLKTVNNKIVFNKMRPLQKVL